MGGDKVGEIRYDARIDTTQMRSDATRAEGIARNSGEGISRSFSLVKVAAAAAATAVLAATTAFGVGAIKSASELQGMRASFESMTGSAELARQVLSDLNKFSFQTAFSSDAINKAAQLLLGAGLEVQNLGRYMKNIGDIAGATGADLGMLTLPLSQALARGKLQTQDFYQILNSGAGKLGQVLREEVAQRGMGDFQKAMEDGLITSEILFSAIEKSAQKGGFAFEGAIKQANTFNGRLSNMQESLLSVGLALLGVNRATGDVDPNGSFARLSDGIKFIGDWVTANQGSIIGFFNLIGDAIGQVGSAWNWMMKEMQPVIEYIRGNQQLWEVLRTSLVAIVVLIGGLIVIGGALVITLAAIIGAVVQFAVFAVGKAIEGLIWLGQRIAWTIQSFAQFSAGVGQAIASVFDWFRRLPGEILGAVGNLGNLLYNSGKSLIGGFINGIKDAAKSIGSTVSDTLQNVRDFFPFSPAKKGPFSGSGYTTYSGMALMRDFAAGMASQSGLVANAAGGVLGGAQGALGAGILSPTISADYTPYSGSGTGAGASVTQNNYISRDIDLDAASRQLAYQMGRG